MRLRAFIRWSVAAVVPLMAAQPTRATETAGDHSWSKLTCMIQDKSATSDQIAMIRMILDDKKTALDLFAKYGLLSRMDLTNKILEILEITNSRIDLVLDTQQRKLWHDVYGPHDTTSEFRPDQRKFRRL